MKAIGRTLGIAKLLIFPLLLLTMVIGSTSLSSELSELVREGMRLAVGAIIPSVFPFIILADLIVASSESEGARLPTRPIERLFGISPTSSVAFLVGSIAGAPIAAVMLSRALKGGMISRDEAERTLAISSSPSLAFAISGIGSAMWSDVRIGVALYLSVITASVIYGALTRKSSPLCTGTRPLVCSRFDIMSSIEKATFTSLRIVGVVTAFSVISGLVAHISAIAPFAVSLLEVGNAASHLSKFHVSPATALGVTAFALGFSGISIHLQVMGAIGGEIRYSRFLFSKILIGLGAAAIFSTAWLLIK